MKKVRLAGMITSWTKRPSLRMAIESPEGIVDISRILGDAVRTHRVAMNPRTGVIRLTFTPRSTIYMYGAESVNQSDMPEVTNRYVEAYCNLTEYMLPSGIHGYWIAVENMSVRG